MKRKRPNLPTLQRKWYARLAREGFQDIEATPGRHDLLSLHEDIVPTPGGLAALSAPYDQLAAAYWRYPWSHPTDRAICKMLADGQSGRDIRRRLTGVREARIRSVIQAVAQWTDPAAFDA